jgi:2-dehydro-3-deoxy-D-pentonate aldolase
MRGVMPALVTPLTPDERFDADSCRRLVEYVLAGGVHGVLALGSSGEVASLGATTRGQVVEGVAAAVDGRVPMLVGVAQTSLEAARADIQVAAGAGAAAALVAPPFYAPLDQAAVLRFYRRVAESSPLPILVYNIPGFTKVRVEPTTVAILASEGCVVGIKDSSRDFEYFEQVLDVTGDVPGFASFVGTDALLLAALALGASGAITITANLAPTWCREVYDLVGTGCLMEARSRQGDLMRLTLALRAGVFPAAAKSALELLGICGESAAPPVPPLAAHERAELGASLTNLGLLTAIEAVA